MLATLPSPATAIRTATARLDFAAVGTAGTVLKQSYLLSTVFRSFPHAQITFRSFSIAGFKVDEEIEKQLPVKEESKKQVLSNSSRSTKKTPKKFWTEEAVRRKDVTFLSSRIHFLFVYLFFVYYCL